MDERDEVIIGLLEIARTVMPDTYWATDSRIVLAHKVLGDKFPSDEELLSRFAARAVDQFSEE